MDWDDPEGTICPWCLRSGYLLVPGHDHNATRCFGPCCRCPQGCPVPGKADADD